jgi:hypothetical protein
MIFGDGSWINLRMAVAQVLLGLIQNIGAYLSVIIKSGSLVSIGSFLGDRAGPWRKICGFFITIP